MKLFVGIDVSSEKLDVCFLTDDNQLSILSEISVANDIEGASFIRETILEFNDSYHFDQIVIGMESTTPTLYATKECDREITIRY
ncbi:hypothetical protein EfmGK941_00300 [Enterococcus faecium]|nr:hypothetical protein EfmGK941_00300 [Enterococcus faecium]